MVEYLGPYSNIPMYSSASLNNALYVICTYVSPFLNHMFSVVRFLLFKSRINVITLFKLRGGWQSATFLPIDVGVRTNIISDASVIVLKYLNTLCLSTNVISKGK